MPRSRIDHARKRLPTRTAHLPLASRAALGLTACVLAFFMAIGPSIGWASNRLGFRKPARAAKTETTQDQPTILTTPPRIAGIPMAMLHKTDLAVAWTLGRLPMARTSQINQIFYLQDRLYILNDQNDLYAIDGEKGVIDWSATLAPAHMQGGFSSAYENFLLFVLGNTCVQVNRITGEITQKTEFKFDISTNVIRTEKRLYVGSTRRHFYSRRLDRDVAVWQTVSKRPPVGSVTLHDDRVYVVTQDDTLHVWDAQDGKDVWDAQTVGQLSGVVIDNQQCFLPSYDTALYCLDAVSGRSLWKYRAGGTLVELPVLTPRLAYQPVEQKSLLCLNRADGSLRWELQGGRSLLAENGPVTYAITLGNELALMSNISGNRIFSFYLHDLELYAPNASDGSIFLASRAGAIVALKPNRFDGPFTESAVIAQLPTATTPGAFPPPAAAPPLIIRPGVGVGDLRFGMNEQQIIDILGDNIDPASAASVLIYNERGLVLGFDEDGNLFFVQCGGGENKDSPWVRAFQGQTAQGIKMGALEQDVINAYGDASFQTDELLSYPEMGMYLHLQDGEVFGITVHTPEAAGTEEGQ